MVVSWRCPVCESSVATDAPPASSVRRALRREAKVTVRCECGQAANVSAPSLRRELEGMGWKLRVG
jgi:hypothetical protein